MLQHICSNCLGIPIDHARYVFSEFFDSEPLMPLPCPRDSGRDGIVLNADIISSIADAFLEFYDFAPQGERLQDCLSRDFNFLSHIRNPDDKREITQSIFGLDSHQNFQLKHNVNYRNRIDEFHEELKSRRRYFFNKHDHFGFIFEMLDSLIGAATPASIIQIWQIMICTYIAHGSVQHRTSMVIQSHFLPTKWAKRQVTYAKEVASTPQAFPFYISPAMKKRLP